MRNILKLIIISGFFAAHSNTANAAASGGGGDVPDNAPESSSRVARVRHPIFAAIDTGNTHEISRFIGDDSSVLERVVYDNRGPLRHAVSTGPFDSVAMLLSLGADPNVEDRHGQTAIFSAIHRYNRSADPVSSLEAYKICLLLFNYKKTNLLKQRTDGETVATKWLRDSGDVLTAAYETALAWKNLNSFHASPPSLLEMAEDGMPDEDPPASGSSSPTVPVEDPPASGSSSPVVPLGGSSEVNPSESS